MTPILGINAYHGDASAAALVGGQLVAAAEEERFTRVKHTSGFPSEALRYVAEHAGLHGERVALAVARDPRARLWRKMVYALRMPRLALDRIRAQSHFADIGSEAASALGVKPEQIEVHRVEHHAAHLASAFFVSPFDEAAVFSLDGLGDFASAMWGIGRGNRITPLGCVTFPHSLGIYYTALTQYLGFPRYGDEYKVMGLASYGEPEFLDAFREIVSQPDDGRMGFRLDLGNFVHHSSGAEMTWAGGEPALAPLYSRQLVRRLGPPRPAQAPIEQRHKNLARSLQVRLEEVVLTQLRSLQRRTGMTRLCLAGGVAFNCVTNGKIRDKTGFEEIYIQSAAGDAGLAIGASLDVYHQQFGHPRGFVMEHSYWGPEFDTAALNAAIGKRRGEFDRDGCVVREFAEEHELLTSTAARIAAGEVVGWFQGRMEWGPRALGNRSILADPRRAEMRDVLNAKIKRREMFRPFAPSILEEVTGEYFEQDHPSPFMLMTYRVRQEKRDVIPATTHIDGTGRLQTVNEGQNRLFYRLLREFGIQTGVPVLLNTSFNENEPVVCTPGQALDCFLRTRMDTIILGKHLIFRPRSAPPGTERSGPLGEMGGGL